MKLSSFRRLVSALLVGVLSGTTLLPQSVFAAPTGSAYRTVMDSLSPYRYYPFDNDFGSQAIGATPTMLGSASTNNAVFIGLTNSGAGTAVAFNDGTQNENTGLGSASTVGRSLSPGRTSEFSTQSTQSGAQASVDAQFPGLNPAYFTVTGTPTLATEGPLPTAYPVSTFGQPFGATGSFNRAFETNARGGVKLDADNSDWATGNFTFAAIVMQDYGQVGSYNPRIFDRGGNTAAATGTAGQMLQIGQFSSSNGGNYISVSPDAAGTRQRNVAYNAPGWLGTTGDSVSWKRPTLLIVSINNSGTNADGSTRTVAEKVASMQMWQADQDRTFALGTGNAASATNAGGLGQVKLGYRDFTVATGLGSAQQGITDGIDEVATWNRILAYDEKEAMYNAMTRPTGGLANSGTGANFTNNGSWLYTSGNVNPVTGAVDSTLYPQQAPQQHGNNSMPYMDVTVNPADGVMTMISPVGDTPAWRTTVNTMTQSGTFQMGPSMRLRSVDTAAVNGVLYMQGLSGTWKGTNGSSTFVPMSSLLWTGGNVTFGSGSKLKIDSPQNQILSQSGVTIDSTTTFELTGTYGNVYYSGAAGSLTGTAGTASNAAGAGVIASGSGASLSTVIQARSTWGQGTGASSAIVRTGSLGGRFASVTLPASPDASGLRVWSSLYENNAADGVGTVDSFKVGLAAPGDINYDSAVTPDDILSLAANGLYNTASPADWRQGDFNQDGVFNQDDMLMAAATGVFNTGPYAMTQGTTTGTAPVNLVYDYATGNVSFDTKGVSDMNGFILKSGSHVLISANANLTAGPFVVTNSGTISSSFAQVFPDGYNLGNVLAAGLQTDFLLSDLTFTYSQASGGGVKTGQLVPEPSSMAVLAAGGLIGTLVLRSRRRRTQG